MAKVSAGIGAPNRMYGGPLRDGVYPTGYWDWQRTPSWKFWRPAWRQRDGSQYPNAWHWHYQTNRQRARQVLEEQFNGGHGNAEQQAPRAEGQHANYFLNGGYGRL